VTLARTTPEDAVRWRRLVAWTRASEGMIAGCGLGCTGASLAALVLVVVDVRRSFIFGGLLALGASLEAVRRSCEWQRRRALDAVAPGLLGAFGLDRAAVELAARSLPSGRLDELSASVAFEREPLHRALEAALGRCDAPLAPLLGPGEEARALVVGLGSSWAAVLRFAGGALVEASAHPRAFAWNDGAGPGVVTLPLGDAARGAIERAVRALPAPEGASVEVAAPPRLAEEAEAVAIGMTLVAGAAARALTGTVDLASGPPPPRAGTRGGPYRSAQRPDAEPAPGEAVILLAEARRCLAPAPRERPEDLVAHAVVDAAARALAPLRLVDPVHVVKGRPLRREGVPVLAGVRRGGGWVDPVAPLPALDPGRRAALADRWRDAALVEHASIAAFARVAEELAALGAPASLVARARAAAVDEERHARDAFSLAAAYSGRRLGPGAMEAPPPRPASIDALAIETFRDGCVGETIAARAARAAVRGCEVPAAGAALTRVALDERRHAELAWDMLAWLLPRASAGARAVLAAERAPARVALRGRGEEAWLARHGWLDDAAEEDVARAAWADEIRPRRAALLGAAGARG
jgi:hypothetical protein